MRVAERTERAETPSSQLLHTIGSITLHRSRRPRPDCQPRSPILVHRTIPNPAVLDRLSPGWGAQRGPSRGPTKGLRRGSPRQLGGSEGRPGDLWRMINRREGSERSRYSFSLSLGKAREGGAAAAAALPNGPLGPPGRTRRRGHCRPEGWGPQQGRQRGGRRGVGTTGSDVAMLAPSSSASLQPPSRWPFQPLLTSPGH